MAQDGAAKPKLSGKLMQLKFMQRAVEKDRVVEAATEQTAAIVSEQWVAEGRDGSAHACTVIMEDDPKPGALSGRMSFKSFNAETERLNAAAEADLKRRAAIASGATEGASVSDAAMAARLAGGVKGGKAGKHAAGGPASADTAGGEKPAKRPKPDGAAGGGFLKPPAFDGGRAAPHSKPV